MQPWTHCRVTHCVQGVSECSRQDEGFRFPQAPTGLNVGGLRVLGTWFRVDESNIVLLRARAVLCSLLVPPLLACHPRQPLLRQLLAYCSIWQWSERGCKGGGALRGGLGGQMATPARLLCPQYHGMCTYAHHACIMLRVLRCTRGGSGGRPCPTSSGAIQLGMTAKAMHTREPDQGLTRVTHCLAEGLLHLPRSTMYVYSVHGECRRALLCAAAHATGNWR
jgi:hypothetical protein